MSYVDEQILLYLIKKDFLLGNIIQKIGPIQLQKSNNYFLELVESIISQQLSVKAAKAISNRFYNLFLNQVITPELILMTQDEKIRSIGVSYKKISYIKDLAQKVFAKEIIFDKFDNMTDEEVIEELIKMKGIGRWTAEMFLMFAMARLDVFSYGDLGLRRAIKKLYSLSNDPASKYIKEISDNWKPYRTIACRYLWKSLEI